jgi:hypothetical protein
VERDQIGERKGVQAASKAIYVESFKKRLFEKNKQAFEA